MRDSDLEKNSKVVFNAFNNEDTVSVIYARTLDNAKDAYNYMSAIEQWLAALLDITSEDIPYRIGSAYWIADTGQEEGMLKVYDLRGSEAKVYSIPFDIK